MKRQRLWSIWRAMLPLVVLIAGGVWASAQAQRSSRPKPKTPGPIHKFSVGSSAKEIKFELFNHLVVVGARVNNSEPLWFIFDTGASNTVVDTKRAAGLGLKASGKIVATGAAGNAEAGRVRNVAIKFPGFEVAGLSVYTLPIDEALSS